MLYLSCFIGVMAFVGFILPLVINRKLKKLLRAAEHPAKSSHPLVKIMVNKFTACYKLKIGVNNVDSFVDKHVYSYKIGGFYLSTWDRLCGQPARILGITAVVALVYGYIREGGQPVWLSTAWIGLGISALLILYGSFFGRRDVIRVFAGEMKDYLENSLRPKLEQEYVYPELLREYRREAAAARCDQPEESRKPDSQPERSQPECSRKPDGRTERSQPEDSQTEHNQPECSRKPDGRTERSQPGEKRLRDRRVIPGRAQVSAAREHPLCREQEIIDEILQEYLS